MIEFEGVHKAFHGQEVLRGVDLVVPEGTTCVLLGQSGSGKTVLLKHLIGLIKPDRGVVRLDGEDVAALDEKGLKAMRLKLGILFQAGALFDSLSVFDNVAFPLREREHLPPGQVKKRVEEVLKLVELEGVGEQFPAALSGGMRKRVAFARSIIVTPRVMLYDEPTAGLDPITTEHLTEEMVAAKKRLGITTLAITYNLQSAFRIADSVALLHEGRIVAQAPPLEFQASSHPAVKAFLRDWLAGHPLKVAPRHPVATLPPAA
jgi:phospholipid/cholesterol/gamma-HCH transport system ATP-binding protein